MRVFLRLFHPLPHHLDAHDVLKVDPEHVAPAIVMFSAAVELRGAAAAGLLPFFGAASAASRRAQAPLNRPTTPYQSRPGHPPRCPPSFPRLPRPDRSAPSRACSRRDATRPCMPSATASRAWAVAQAVAPQHRPLAATSTSTTGASRTPCLVRRVRQSPGDATDCDTSASRPRLAHDCVVRVECRLPLQLRRDRAAGLPSAIAQPHPLHKAIATFLPDGRSATPENQTWRETLRSVRC